MIEDLPNVPPAVLFLIKEVAAHGDFRHAKRRLKSMLKEIHLQSEAYIENHAARSVCPPDELDIHLHGGLDLFNPLRNGCASVKCRVKSADALSRSIGLIADHAWLTDPFSDWFTRPRKLTDRQLEWLVDDAIVLARLWPLIEAGIVKFRPPCTGYCSCCYENFDNEVKALSYQISKRFQRQIKNKTDDKGSIYTGTGDCFEPSLNLYYQSHVKKLEPASKIAEGIIYDEIRTALLVGKEAIGTGGAIFSNSRVGLSSLLHLEGRVVGKESLNLLHKNRHIQIPWVSELQPSQIVQLRQEAINALPAFRERMARVLSVGYDLGVDVQKSKEVIQGLREQAVEVRAELRVTQKHKRTLFKGVGSLVGLGMSIFGAATGQPHVAMGGALGLINLLFIHSNQEKEVEKATIKPGYVLVKAQDILAHAH